MKRLPTKLAQNVKPLSRCIVGGRYYIQQIYTYGGNSYIYQGKDLATNKQVLIKELIAHKWFKRGNEKAVSFSVNQQIQDLHYSIKNEFLFAFTSPNEFVCSVSDFVVENNTYYIIMPCENGKVLSEVNFIQEKITLKQFYGLFSHLLRLVQWLQQIGVTHGDLKPSNLFLEADNGCLKMLDFGSIKHLSLNKPLLTEQDNRRFISKTKGFYHKHYSLNSDMYSVAVIMAKIGRPFTLPAETKKLIAMSASSKKDELPLLIAVLNEKQYKAPNIAMQLA